MSENNMMDEIKVELKSNAEFTNKLVAEVKNSTENEVSNLQKKFAEMEVKNQELAIANGDLKNEVKSIDNCIKAVELKHANAIVTVGGISGIDAEYKSQLDGWLRKGKLIDEEVEAKAMKSLYGENSTLSDIKDGIGQTGYIIETKTMRTNVNTDGGYFTRNTVGQTVGRVFEDSKIRDLASVITIGSGTYEFLLDDDKGITGGFVNEEEIRNTTGTPKISQRIITVHDQYAKPRITQKLLDDAVFDVQRWLQEKTNEELSFTENNRFVVGSNVNAPKGFLNYSAWTTPGVYEQDKLEYTNSGLNGVISGDTLMELQDSLFEKYQAGAVFIMHRSTFTEIKKQKNGIGAYMLNSEALSDGVQPRLLGKPVIFDTNIPKIATGSKSIVYGNFKEGYQIVDRLGIRVLRDPYSQKGSTEYYTTKRVGGDVKNFQAIKIYKLSD